jgi:hypothetical protein
LSMRSLRRHRSTIAASNDFLPVLSILDVPTSGSSGSTKRHRTRLTAKDAIRPLRSPATESSKTGRTTRAGRRKLFDGSIVLAFTLIEQSSRRRRIPAEVPLSPCWRLLSTLNRRDNSPTGRPNSTHVPVLKIRGVERTCGEPTSRHTLQALADDGDQTERWMGQVSGASSMTCCPTHDRNCGQ